MHVVLTVEHIKGRKRSRMRIFVFATALLIGFAQSANALKIGFVPFPEEGHMGPCLPMFREALDRGHEIEVYGPEITGKYLKGRFPEIKFTSYGHNFDLKNYNETWFEAKLINDPILSTFAIIEEKMRDYHERLVPELKAVLDPVSPADRPDVMLIDHGSNIASSVADHFDIPAVMLWPLVLQFPTQLNPAFPSIATGLGIRMTWYEKSSIISSSASRHST